MVLSQLSHTPLGGMPFPIIVGRAILLRNGCGPQGNGCPHVRMENRCAQHLMRRGDAPVAVDLVQTRRTVHRLGGQIPCAIERPSGVPIKERHRFQRLAALELPKDACEQRA